MIAESELLNRIISPHSGGLSLEHARYILSLDFSLAEHARYHEFSAKANEGMLAENEKAELDAFLAVNAILMILQSKARVSLRQHPSAA